MQSTWRIRTTVLVLVVVVVSCATQILPFLEYHRNARVPEIEFVRRELPRVILADAYVVMGDEDAARAIGSRRTNLRRTVVLDRAPASPPLESTSGGAVDAAVVRFDGRLRVMIETLSSGPRMLVLNDAHYPGWEATVDGQPVPLYRANIGFRAISLPEGSHIVEFRYRPPGLIYIVSTSVLVAILVVVVL